ncbi:MAG: cupin domain-containing protein [Ferruginibacter sp.]|nr:cupin domain-containing protein [Cytophagales bacterium]
MQAIDRQTVTNAAAQRYHAGTRSTFLVMPHQTNNALAVVEMSLAQGAEPPRHVHTREDETFLVHEGELQMSLGDETFVLGPGMSAFLPRGIEHAFRLLTPTARLTVMITPGKFANFFWNSSVEVSHDLPPAPQGPPPVGVIEKMVADLVGYGVFFV